MKVEGICDEAPSSRCICHHSEGDANGEFALEEIVDRLACLLRGDVQNHHRQLRMGDDVVPFGLHLSILVALQHFLRELLDLEEEHTPSRWVFVLHLFCISTCCCGLDEECEATWYPLNIELDSRWDDSLLVPQFRMLTANQSHYRLCVEHGLPCLESTICPAVARLVSERDVLFIPFKLATRFHHPRLIGDQCLQQISIGVQVFALRH